MNLKTHISNFTEEGIEGYKLKYISIINKPKESYSDANKYNKETINFYKRMEKYIDHHILFMNDFHVAFENNQAESDVRMLKSKTKVCGCFNTLTGVQNFLNIRSVLQSCIKKKMNTLQAIMNLHNGIKVFI